MAKQKYQHYVPQVYLKNWVDKNKQIHVYNKKGEFVKSCHTENILGMKNLYTKGVGYLLSCSKKEKEEVFKCLDGYNVYYNNKKVNDVEELARLYYCFEEWIIKNHKGEIVSKKSLKNDIESVRILNIENLLGKVEDKWNNIYDAILSFLDGNIGEEQFIDKYMKQLKRFIFIQDWRNVDKINLFENAIDKVMDFLKGKDDELLDEIKEEFSRCYFLSNLEKFINGCEDSVLKNNFDKFMMAHMTIFLSTGNKQFLINDNPVLYIDSKRLKYGIYYPISPNIVLGFFKGNRNKINIEQMPYNSIKEINKIIKERANEFYISSKKIEVDK